MCKYIWNFVLKFIYICIEIVLRGHHITFVNGFRPEFHLNGLREMTPTSLVNYIENFTDWDLVGARLENKNPVSIWQALQYPAEVSILKFFLCVFVCQTF